MASVTESPQQPPLPKSTPPAPSNEELLVDQQIRQTRRAIKMVDLTAGIITLVIGVLGYLLTMAVLEHWIIPGGWSDGMRLVLFGILLVGIGIYSWRTFWSLLMQSINPIYAAHAIEQNSPSLKNSLLNLLLLRNHKQHLPRQVYQAIEQQAAQRLSQVKRETTVDRSIILRLGYILVALTAIAALYQFLSPKDPISSIGRVLMPWSEIATPSRVEILNITPGETQVARGEQLTISAEIHGLDKEEPVRLLYSTDDKQIIEQEILMTTAEGESVFSCRLPGRIGGLNSSGGVQQSLSYWIEAGDARSPHYQVTVFSRPTLIVQRLRYEYPTYTGIPTREAEHTGDIRAVEGTRVTIYAQANKLIKAAHVDFDANGQRAVSMNVNEQLATVTFPLELRADRRTPKHQSYLLRYQTTNSDNKKYHPSPKYQIEVQPDFSPEISLLLPEEAMIEVALNQEVQFELEARDPDYALSQVVLIGKLGQKKIFQEKLLQKNHTGRFVGKLRKTPEEMGLKVGDVLEYWGAAADNRRPKANLAYSAHRKLRVVGRWQGNPNEDKKQDGEDEQKQQPNQDGQGGDGESGAEGQAGGGESSSSDGEAGDEGQQGSEGEATDASEEGEQQNKGGQGGKGDQESNGDSEGSDGEMSGKDSAESKQDGEQGDDQKGDNEPGEGNNSDNNNSGGGQGKVSSQGDDDGEAFDRMADHFDKKDGDQQGDKSGEDKNKTDKNKTGGSQQDDAQQDQAHNGQGAQNDTESKSDGADGKRDPDQSPGGDDSSDDDSSNIAKKDTTKNDATEASESDGKGNESDQPGAEQDASSEAGGEKGEEKGEAGTGKDQESDKQPGEEPGAKGEPAPNKAGDQAGKDDADKNNNGQEKGGEGEQEDEQGNKMSPEQGEPGAGSEAGEDQTAPNPDGTQKPKDKQGKSGDSNKDKGDEAASSAKDNAESDSQDGEGGDRSGGGEKGAGQQADQAGKGTGGENESADSGQGKSSEKGEGETGQDAGDQKKSDGKTGQSSEEQSGQGSKASDKPAGEQPNQDPSKFPNESGKSGESASADGSPQSPSQSPPKSGDPQGANSGNSSSPQENEVEPGDDANLDYAKQQTELILNRLEEQLNKKEVDQELLDKLGWSKDELRRFVDRWKNLKQQADNNRNEKTADQELNDALRSLGLNKNRRTGYRSKITKDQLRDLQEAYRGRVPLEFQEQIRSYHKGTATAQENK